MTSRLWVVCIIVRATIAIISTMVDKNRPIRFFSAIFTLVIGISFLHAYSKGNTVGFFGGEVWWHDLRLFHAITYTTFAVCSLHDITFAHYLLWFDVGVGGLMLFVRKVCQERVFVRGKCPLIIE